MLFKKLWRTMWQYKAQFLSMIIMTTLGIGVFIGFNMEWYTLDQRTGSFNEDTGFADYRIYAKSAFSEDDIDKIAAIDGVDDASRFSSVIMDVKDQDEDSLFLTITENPDVSGFVVTDGAKYDAKSKDGIWLSDQYARANDIKVGDSLALTAQGMDVKGEVSGLIKASEYTICVRDSSQLMPDFNVFGFAYISPAMYEKSFPMAAYPSIHIRSDLDKGAIEDKIEDALDYQPLMVTKDDVVSYAGPQGEIDEGITMAGLLPPIFLLIAILSMVTTMHRIAAQEKVQIGTLKALGFKNRRILRHYTSYALMIGIIGCVLGSALGYAICGIIMDPEGPMGQYMDMPDWSKAFPSICIPTLIVILIGLSLVGFLSVRSMLRGTAADALRPYAPKKMKALFFEKMGWFQKLSFGPRWNLRDSFRHKARSGMSILGVISCMLIILTCLGMQDSVSGYLNDYYYKSMNYESRIYLDERASKEQRDKLIDQYGEDTSQTIGVKLKDKSVALNVYHLEDDSVTFINRDNEPVTLGEEGAYVCVRLADKYGLEKGDQIKVSVYGTDDTYTLKVAGVIRSSLAETVVLSDDYAKEVGITYMPDSIYTGVATGDIDEAKTIKSVQSRNAVISSFDSFITIMYNMIMMFIVVGILLGIVVLYNLGVMTYTERYRELATLKVLGFKDKKISRLLYGQNFTSTVIGIIIGIPLANYLLEYFMQELGAEYEMTTTITPLSYVISIGITFGVSALVSLMTARKNKKIDMVSALKSAE